MQGDERRALFFLQIVVLAVGGEGAVIKEGLEGFALFRVLAEAVDDAVNPLATLLALAVGFTATLDPRQIFDSLDERVEDIGGIFPGDLDAVLRAGDGGDEFLHGIRGLRA